MNSKNLYFTFLESDDPYENLAFENQVLESIDENSIHLLLWKNRPSIVMGRFQNPYKECNLDLLKRDKVLLVRRQSGGGCVYHDHENINYSFICSKNLHDKNNNHQVLINTLKNFNISAYSTKRVDLFVEDKDGVHKKFSGSAFKEKKNTAFHHGTLLFNSNIDLLNAYLTPKEIGISESKSIESLRSKVVNLQTLSEKLNLNSFIESLLKEFSDFYNSKVERVELDLKNRDYLEKLSSQEWIYFETPKFKLLADSGCYELTLRKLKIEELKLDVEDIHPAFISHLQEDLKGKNIIELLDSDYFDLLIADYGMYEAFIIDFKNWLKKQLAI